MKRIRVAGLIEMEGGYALMHRMNVKPSDNPNKPHGEYYVFPGGGLEEDDASLEAGVAREVLEEFGIEVEVKEQLYFRNIKEDLEVKTIRLWWVSQFANSYFVLLDDVLTDILTVCNTVQKCIDEEN